MLTQEQMEFFMQNGYVACGKILADEEIEALRGEYDAVFAEARHSGSYRNLSLNGSAEETEGGQAVYQIMRATAPYQRAVAWWSAPST